MRISDWSSDVCSSDLARAGHRIVAVDARSRAAARLVLVDRNHGRMRALGALFLPVRRPHADREEPLHRSRAVQGWQFPVRIALRPLRSEEHTSEIQYIMRISYADFGLIKYKYLIH